MIFSKIDPEIRPTFSDVIAGVMWLGMKGFAIYILVYMFNPYWQ